MRWPASSRRVAALALVPALALALALYNLRADADVVEDTDALIARLETSLQSDGAAAGHIYEQLERQLERNPSEPRALVLKARLDMQAQRYEPAAAGFKQALAGSTKVAKDPTVWVEYAEALGMNQGGILVGEPLRLVEKALALDANHAGALDLAGSGAWEKREFAGAAHHWKRLLALLEPGTPRHVELSMAIERAQQRAKLALPPAK